MSQKFFSKGSSEVNDKVVFCLPYLGLLKWVWRGKKVPLDNFCLHLSLWASFFLCESSSVATQRIAEPLLLVRVIPLCSHVHVHTGWFLWRTHSPFSTVNTPVMPAPPNSRCQCPMQAEATVSWADAFQSFCFIYLENLWLFSTAHLTCCLIQVAFPSPLL